MSITAEVLRVRELFNPTADLRVPPFQRGFSWTEKEVGQLLTDLLTAFEQHNTYFLGAIVVIQLRPRTPMDVVDGQQRVTTLTMMLAALRDLSPSADEQAMLHQLIGQDQRGIPLPLPVSDRPRWRLTLNHHDAPFFRDHVQTREAPGRLRALDAEGLPESHGRIARAMTQVRDELAGMSDDERKRLSQWLLDEVTFVRVRVTEHNLGYRVFLGLNGRGLPLADHDILKSILLERSKFTDGEAILHSNRWAEYSARLTSQGFGDLLKQIRIIYDRQLKGEFIDGLLHALKPRMEIADFLNDALPAFVDGYEAAVLGVYRRLDPGSRARRALGFLQAIDHGQWRAPALRLLLEHAGDADRIGGYLERLERVAQFLQHGVSDREARQKRYRRILDVVDAGQVDAADSPLDLTPSDKERFRERLAGRFSNPKQRRALVLRINAVAPGGADVAPDQDATVEHILPRTITPGTQEAEDWADLKDRDELTDCIGNFTLLTHAENQLAGHANFGRKLEIYFRNGAPSFAITRDLEGLNSWPPAKVRERRDRLLAYLVREWGLDA